MKISTIDGSQRKAAWIAGLACPISFVTVVAVNFGIFERLIVSGNPAETARNILAHETLFRIGIAGDLVYCVGVVVLLTALYVILKPVDQNLALLAAFGRLVHGFTWLLVTLNLFTALRLLSGADYSRAFGPDQLPVVARLYLSGFDAYYVGLLFWGLGATVGSYLWFKSGYVPRALAAFGVISSAWCAACTFVLYIFPDFPKLVNLWWFDSPMAVFELALSFWLLFKGLRPSGIPEPDKASDRAQAGAV
ncbi:MAG TPA: DUF4386 domain-containing protein [Candidatus Acidoferrales bacterium]